MFKALYSDFKIIDRSIQYLDPRIFIGGPWRRLAHFSRGLKEYICYQHQDGRVYVEEYRSSSPGVTGTGLYYIEDEQEFKDCCSFLNYIGVAKWDHSTEIVFNNTTSLDLIK